MTLGINRIGKEPILQKYQDNVTVWDIRLWWQKLVVPVGQHCKVALSVPCYKSVAITAQVDKMYSNNTQTNKMFNHLSLIACFN